MTNINFISILIVTITTCDIFVICCRSVYYEFYNPYSKRYHKEQNYYLIHIILWTASVLNLFSDKLL